MPSAYHMAIRLQKIVPRSWLAGIANRVMAAKRDPRRFAVDRAGNWVNIQPEGTIVDRDLHTAFFAQIEDQVSGYWFSFYRPKAGDVVVDVGAGIGEDALVLSRLVGPNGKVHAIEAHPATYRCLTSTVERSGLSNVETYQLAITESDGSVVISDGAAHLANSIAAEGSGLRVPSRSLDDFIADIGLPAIDFLKMNIEGAEVAALDGLNDRASAVRHVAISCHDFVARAGGGDHFRTKDRVRQRLVELGYAIQERTDARYPWEDDVIFGRRSSTNS